MIGFLYRPAAFMLGLWCLYAPASSQETIADFSVAKEVVLRNIPEEYIHKARTELVIAYQHTSHGTHVSRGVFGLQDYKTGDTLLFGVSETANDTTLEFRDYALEDYAPPGVTAIDLSVDETAFIQTTRNYLDAPENATVNVVMWSWCNIAGHDPVNNYLPGMDSLISEYGEGGTKIGTGPGQREIPVHFIYMTGHANKNANTGPLNPKEQAQLITDSCEFKQQFCLDYYSIDTHDMEDTYYEDAGDDGDSDSYGGNFYHDWQDAHVLGEHYYENKRTPGGDVVFGEHNTQHITANRKAYAFWWILARIAGWDGSYPVTSIEVSSEGDSTWVMTGSELQFYADVLPEFATDTTISWSVISRSGSASISSAGLLQGELPGDIEVVAMALDGSGVTDTLLMTISDPLVPVTSVTLSTVGGLTELDMGSTLQCLATVLPDTASNAEITWSMANGPGTASVNGAGLVTGVNPGLVEVIATAGDGTGMADTLELNILDTTIYVIDVEIESPGNVVEITSGEELQLSATVLPVDASLPEVAWNVINGSGTATISAEGLLRGSLPGGIDVVALAQDGSGAGDTMSFTVLEPVIMVTQISIGTPGDITTMEAGAQLPCSVTVLPEGADNPQVFWSLDDLSGHAEINQEGLVSALTEGLVEVIATSEDGSGVADTLQLTIVGTVILVNDIEIQAPGGISEVHVGESLQLTANILPQNATNQVLAWGVIQGTGTATISGEGLLTAGSAGEISITALATDISGVGDTLNLTLTPQGIEVTEIRVSAAGGVTDLLEGNSLQFFAEVLPENADNPAFVWSVLEGTGTATITPEGLLNAQTAGTVEVVATAQDGSGVTGSLLITIHAGDIPVTHISITSEGCVDVLEEGETLQFSVTVLPSNATNSSVSWSVHHGTGSAVISQSGLLTAGSEGTVEVRATALDGSGVHSAYPMTITGTTGLADREDDPAVLVYPNPSRGIFYLNTGALTLDKIRVYSLVGSLVAEWAPQAGERVIEMDLSGEVPGTFYIECISKEFRSVHQVIINR
jgi:uncharacterized protein YjdB